MCNIMNDRLFVDQLVFSVNRKKSFRSSVIKSLHFIVSSKDELSILFVKLSSTLCLLIFRSLHRIVGYKAKKFERIIGHWKTIYCVLSEGRQTGKTARDALWESAKATIIMHLFTNISECKTRDLSWIVCILLTFCFTKKLMNYLTRCDAF